MDATLLLGLILACSPLVDSNTALALVQVESAANPNAIGVVGGELRRQPIQRAEALATARALQVGGWNFSVGVAQINVRNFDRLGLTLESSFDPCTNLAAMQAILVDCLDRASAPHPSTQGSLRQALSCYYSGNFTTGFDHGYVRRVARAAARMAVTPVPSPDKES